MHAIEGGSMPAVIHTIKFRVKDSIASADALAVNERFQREVAPSLPGLERREATISDDGEWTLINRYRSMDAATNRAGAGGPAADAMMAIIDMATMSSSFATVVSE